MSKKSLSYTSFEYTSNEKGFYKTIRFGFDCRFQDCTRLVLFLMDQNPFKFLPKDIYSTVYFVFIFIHYFFELSKDFKKELNQVLFLWSP